MANPLKHLLSYEDAWYDAFESYNLTVDTNDKTKRDYKKIVELKRKAEELYKGLVQLSSKESSKFGNSEDKWMEGILLKGTASDRVAGMTLLIQKAPCYRFKHLDLLLAEARRNGQTKSSAALEAAKDLFTTAYLPERHLVPFHQRPFDDNVTDAHLVLWYIEDQIKAKYNDFITIIENGANDVVDIVKKSAIKLVLDLLTAKPEGESRLLAILVNKLGDNVKKFASQSMYYLTILLESHPMMLEVVVTEIDQFIHRPKISDRAIYYAIVFLGQVVLHKNQPEAAEKIMGVYFALFTKIFNLNNTTGNPQAQSATKDTPLSKRKEVRKEFREKINSRLLSALLSGVSRALPYVDAKKDVFTSHVDTLFRIVWLTPLTKATQALTLLFQIAKQKPDVMARYYKALYGRLVALEVFETSKPALLVNLLYKSLLHDTDLIRMLALTKVMLQLCFYQAPNVICAILYSLSMVTQKRQDFAQSLQKVLTGAPTMPSNIQLASRRVVQFYEELTHAASANEMTGVAVDNQQAEKKSKKKKKNKKSKSAQTSEGSSQSTEEVADASSLGPLTQKEVRELALSVYLDRTKKRDPEYSFADTECLWELSELCHHYHPSVSSWASMLQTGKKIEYKGDPVLDFTTTAFLDRFSFKKPKKNLLEGNLPTNSTMQPKFTSHSASSEPVTSASFLQQPVEAVREDEVFFYQYFQQRHKDEAGTIKERRQRDSDRADGEHSANDSFSEDEINEILKQKLPKDFNFDPSEESDGWSNEQEEDEWDGDGDMDVEGDKASGKKQKKSSKTVTNEEDSEGSDDGLDDDGDLEGEMGDDSGNEDGSDFDDSDDFGDFQDDSQDFSDDDDGGELDGEGFDDDDGSEGFDDDSGGDSDEDSDDAPRGKGKRGQDKKGGKSSMGLFAPADEFEKILESSGNNYEEVKKIRQKYIVNRDISNKQKQSARDKKGSAHKPISKAKNNSNASHQNKKRPAPNKPPKQKPKKSVKKQKKGH